MEWDNQSIQLLIDALPFYTLLIDEDHRILAANKSTKQHLGLQPEDIIGHYCPKVIHGLNSAFPGCPLEEAVESGQPVKKELFDKESNAWFASFMFPIELRTKSGKKVFLHYVQDITEQKNYVVNLNQSLEHQKTFVQILNKLQECKNNVEAFETVIDQILPVSWLGLTSSAVGFLVDGQALRMIASRNLSSYLERTCSHVPLGRCLCGMAAQTGKRIICSTVGNDHLIRYEEMKEHGHAIIPLQHENRVIGILNLYLKPHQDLDTTHLDFLEAIALALTDTLHRLHMQSQILHTDRLSSMGMLAAGVAHEINNPLTYTLYNLESLSRDLPRLTEALGRYLRVGMETSGNETISETLGKIGTSLDRAMLDDLEERLHDATEGAQRVRDIVRDLKTFSHTEEEKLMPVVLDRVIEGAINMSFHEIKYRSRLVKEYGRTLPVMANDGRLSQVFLNLLINAAHAIDEGNVEHNEIRIRTWSEGNEILAEVSDTGRGIPPEHFSRLFEPFFTTKAAGVGTGLGLSICRSIISSFGGRIEVHSEVGKGTRFLIRLPAMREEESGAGTEQISVAERGEQAVHGRILVVDDEPGIGTSIKRMLRNKHDVVIVTSGQEAKELLENDSSFDLILCDLMMPMMSGKELYEWLANTHTDLVNRMVFMTGGAFTPKCNEFLQRISNVRIEKPFDPKSLSTLVGEMVLLSRAKQDKKS
jgi:PAS domain S-box-containing protein